MGGCEDDGLAALLLLLLEEGRGGRLQNEFGALNALVLVTLRGEKTGARTRDSDQGGVGGLVDAREMDKVPEVRDRNRRAGQMERSRRHRSRKQNVSGDHREKGRMGGGREREKKKVVSTLDRPKSHTKKAFHPPRWNQSSGQ